MGNKGWKHFPDSVQQAQRAGADTLLTRGHGCCRPSSSPRASINEAMVKATERRPPRLDEGRS